MTGRSSKEIKYLVEAIEKVKDLIDYDDKKNPVLTETYISNEKLLLDRLYEKVRKQFLKPKKTSYVKRSTDKKSISTVETKGEIDGTRT
jgi:hypothetical protein